MVRVDINIVDNRWKKYMKKSHIKSTINNIFEKLLDLLKYNSIKKTSIELTMIFTSDFDIKEINRRYRNINLPTNVLSFPTYEKEFFKELITNKYIFIGDIILSFETIQKESVEQNKSFFDHLTHLIIHSILHLIGFDHIKSEDANKMEAIEIKLLKKMNINNPY